MSAPAAGLEQNLVRQNVEPLLRFALDIDGVRVAEHVTQCAFAYGVADRLARTRDGFEQQPQIRIDAVLALAANQIVRKRQLHEWPVAVDSEGKGASGRAGIWQMSAKRAASNSRRIFARRATKQSAALTCRALLNWLLQATSSQATC